MKKNMMNYFVISIVLCLALAVGCKKDKKDDIITPEPTSVTDIDGNVYKVVKIGTQYWMAENLRVTHFKNGDPIPTTVPPTLDIQHETTPVYQWIAGNNDSLVADYGRFYTYHAVLSYKGLAPKGWHIPSKEEYIVLFGYLGGNPGAASGWSVGGKLKEEGLAHWNHPNVATNESGWTARGAGKRDFSGNFLGLKDYAYFWAIDNQTGTDAGVALRIVNNGDGYSMSNLQSSYGFSVRCLKD